MNIPGKPVALGTERLGHDRGGDMASAQSDANPVSNLPLEEQVVQVLKSCYDPEIPVNIHELGLIYGLDVEPSGVVNIRMTLTSPACPVAGSLPGEVETKVKAVPGVSAVKVELVWDPPWDPERMTEAARLQLGLF